MLYLFHNLAQHGLSIAGLIAIGLAAFGLGWGTQRLLRLQTEDSLETTIWRISLGLALAAMLLTVLGLIGALYVPLILALTAISACIGLGTLAFSWLRKSAENQHDMQPAPARDWTMRWALAAIVLVSIFTFAAALAPPVAGDALCYHLELPKQFLNHHAIVYLPFNDNSTFPLLGEMLYLWGLACGGAVTAQLMAWFTGVLLALASVLLARPLVGRQSAWIAAAVVLLVPGISTHMAAPLSDLAVALWLTLAICSWQKALYADQPRGWIVATGILLGAALATKYVALLFLVAFALTYFIRWLRDRQAWNSVPRALLAALLLGVVLASPWYLRAWIHRGDPVYPFLTQALGASSTAPETVDKRPMGRSPLAALAAPWQLTMQPQQLGGRAHQLGPLFLMLLPGLIFCRRLRGMNTLLAIAGIYALLWFGLRQNARFLYPIVPVLAVAATWALVELRRMPVRPRVVALSIIATILLLCAALPAYRVRDRILVALGMESRSAYLHRSEPSYNAAVITNQLGGRSASILSQDFRGFYYRGHFTRESIFRRLTRYDLLVKQPQQFSSLLKQHGFTHLVLVQAANSPVAQDETLAQLVDAEIACHARACDAPYRTLADYPATDSDGVCWHYRLLEIR